MTTDPSDALIQLVTGLEKRHFDQIDRPLPEVLGHTLLQGVTVAVMRLNPNVDRSAMTSGPTWRDVFAWLEGVDVGDVRPDDTAARPPRGSYRSPSTTLRQLGASDVDALYGASLDPRMSHRWRFRGRTPSPADFQRLVFSSEVLCQYMVVEVATGRSVGLVTAYNAELTAGHVYVAVQRLPDEVTGPSSKGLMIEGTFVFLQYLFDHFTLRKLYLEVPEYNLSLFELGINSLLQVEGRLREHLYWGDRHWDMYHLALYRKDWDQVAQGFRGSWPSDHFERAEVSSP
jgi:hypothetical protein